MPGAYARWVRWGHGRTADGSVRRLHVLPGRPGVAAAARRGARGAQGCVCRCPRGSRAALRLAATPIRRPASAPRSTSSSGRSRSATRISASSARRSTATPLAGWLETPYSYLATTKASQYTQRAHAPGRSRRSGSPYLVVYPFVKVRPWYACPRSTGRRRWTSTCAIGHEFETIHNHTTYSFGIDDQEFMTVFECDEPADFMHLMADACARPRRRSYTERDTPIFVGQRWTSARRSTASTASAPASKPELATSDSCSGAARARCARRRRPTRRPRRSARGRSRPVGGCREPPAEVDERAARSRRRRPTARAVGQIAISRRPKSRQKQ